MSQKVAYIIGKKKIVYVDQHVNGVDLPDPIEEYRFLSNVSGMIGSTTFRVNSLYEKQLKKVETYSFFDNSKNQYGTSSRSIPHVHGFLVGEKFDYDDAIGTKDVATTSVPFLPPNDNTPVKLIPHEPVFESVDVMAKLMELKRKGEYYTYLLNANPDTLESHQTTERNSVIETIKTDNSSKYDKQQYVNNDINTYIESGDAKIYIDIPNVTDLVHGNVSLALSQILEHIMDDEIRKKNTYRDIVMGSTQNVQTWFAKLVAANIERSYTISGSKEIHGAFKSNRANSDIAGIAPRFANLIYDKTTTKLDLKKTSYYVDQPTDYVTLGSQIAGVGFNSYY